MCLVSEKGRHTDDIKQTNTYTHIQYSFYLGTELICSYIISSTPFSPPNGLMKCVLLQWSLNKWVSERLSNSCGVIQPATCLSSDPEPSHVTSWYLLSCSAQALLSVFHPYPVLGGEVFQSFNACFSALTYTDRENTQYYFVGWLCQIFVCNRIIILYILCHLGFYHWTICLRNLA